MVLHQFRPRFHKSQTELLEVRHPLTEERENPEIQRRHANIERHEAAKALKLLLTWTKCGLTLKTAECQVIDAGLRKARQKITDKDTVFMVDSIVGVL